MVASSCYPETGPTIDRILDTLSDSHRREIIYYFETVADGPTATVEELVGRLEERVPDRDRRELTTAIHHHHLPKLQSRGWLEFDRRSGTVRYEGHQSVAALLEELAAAFATER